jgi:hypothetical protein
MQRGHCSPVPINATGFAHLTASSLKEARWQFGSNESPKIEPTPRAFLLVPAHALKVRALNKEEGLTVCCF